MKNKDTKGLTEDPWKALRKYTQARIAIGRCGSAIPTSELLAFKLAHAQAIDAVHLPLNNISIAKQIETIFQTSVLQLHSAAVNRSEYLRRPDLGRRLSDASIQLLQRTPKASRYDIALVVADGLSSTAIETNINPLLQTLIPLLKQKNFSLAPISVVQQGRVAVADSVAELLGARLTVIFIGERPGLKSPDSLGIYMTYNPQQGTTDERRNCISNVRKDGLSYPVACAKLMYLIEESFKRQLSGVDLKDELPTDYLNSQEQAPELSYAYEID